MVTVRQQDSSPLTPTLLRAVRDENRWCFLVQDLEKQMYRLIRLTRVEPGRAAQGLRLVALMVDDARKQQQPLDD